MTVVSNTGPHVAIGKLGRLDLLEKLCGEIFVPPEVEDEMQLCARQRLAHARGLAKMLRQGQLRVAVMSEGMT